MARGSIRRRGDHRWQLVYDVPRGAGLRQSAGETLP